MVLLTEAAPLPDTGSLAEEVRALDPTFDWSDVAVLALTIHEGREYFFEMLNAGASGYVPKSAATGPGEFA